MVHRNLREITQRLEKLSGSEGKRGDKPLFKTKYGYFRMGGREFVITDPKPPGLWANFLTNGNYTALLTPTGGGYSWVEEAGFNRVLREHPYSHLLEDKPGRYVYVKDLDTGDVWSINYQPMQKGTNFEAVHSLGYSSTSTTYKDIFGKITFFIPQKGMHEKWVVEIHNKDKKKRRLRLYTYSEFVLGSFKSDIEENAFNSFFAQGKRSGNALLFTKTSLQTKDNTILSTYDKIGFFASSVPFDQYELSRRDFVGFGNSVSNPVGVMEDTLHSCERAGENMIGCVSFEVELKGGEEKQFYFALGAVQKESDISHISKTLTKGAVNSEREEVVSYWDTYIKKIWIETPDEGLNIWFNYWLKYQTYFNAHWSEMDSFYIGGGGGFGVRDTAQHIWAALPFERDIYLKQLRLLLSHQYSDGRMPHGIRVFENQPIDSPHSDDPCWLVFAVLNYIEETNDIAFLEEVYPFEAHGKKKGGEEGTVLRHIIRATDYSLRFLSERGLPQMRIADWNDGLSVGPYGKGESLLVAGLLANNLKRLTDLLSRIGRFDKVKEYEFAYKRLSESVHKFCWDGKWFIRATLDHHKKPLGSNKNRRGKIFLDSNTWIIMSGLAGERKHETVQSLWEYLMTKYGALIFNPAYKREDIERGVISQFVPGAKENAAIFLHTNAWFLIALAQSGETTKAWELLKTVNPVYAYFERADTYKVEPYVLPEFIFGNESDKFGEGSFTWVTGSAEWFLRGVLDFFLGVRPHYDELAFDPKVPDNWSFTVERDFQGKRWRYEYNKGKEKIISQVKKSNI